MAVTEKRLDIQGLRALAVLLVLLFHLWPEHLTGGFIGVDVFFVISGFLITAHLLSEIERSGTVSLTRFWARRIRRLLPAGFVVLAFCLIVTYLLLPQTLWDTTLRQIAASALYVQNWILAGDAVDYLGADNDPTLVQHYWTLSVEEQFYIVWPLLLVAALFIAARVRRLSRRTVIAIVLTAVFAGSLVCSVIWTQNDQSFAYFATPVRAWEFALGGLVAMVPALTRAPRRSPADGWRTIVLSWLAVGAILYAAVMFDAETAFPGWTALLPVGATALLLYLRDDDSAWSPQYLAKAGPIQLIGDTSYAIYLWHWPLIVIYPYVTGTYATALGKVGIAIATIALAIATKYLVEDPARAPRTRSRRPAYTFMTAGIAGLLVFALVPSWAMTTSERSQADLTARSVDVDGCIGAFAILNDCEEPYAVTDAVRPAAAARDTYRNSGVVQSGVCIDATVSASACTLGLEGGDLTIAVLGDSHAQQILHPLDEEARTRGWTLIPFTKAGCSGFEDADVARAQGLEDHLKNCVPWGERAANKIVSDSTIDVVLLTSRSAVKPGDEDSARERISRLQAAGKQVVVLKDTPALPPKTRGPRCVEQAGTEYDPCAWKPKSVDDFLIDAAVSAPEPVTIFSIDDLICDASGTCHMVIGETIVYTDDNHLTFSFARTVGPALADRLETAVVAP